MTQNEACLLSCEDEQEFAEFRRGLDEAHQPTNMHEHFLVEEFAQAAWELRREARIEQRVRRIDREWEEDICAENNADFLHYEVVPLPHADWPDF